MEKVFHGPGGPVRYEILFEGPDLRVVVADGRTLGELMATPSTDPRWCILGLGVSSPLFCSQYSAAEYLLLWKAVKEPLECPYCGAGWLPGSVVMREDGSSVVVYGCSKCGALESRRCWPPEDPDQ